MSEYHCHECSVFEGLIASPSGGNMIDTTYQVEKYRAKHGTPSASVPLQGIWTDSSTGFYRDRVLDALDRGFIEFDNAGRRNIVCPTNEHTGWRYEYGEFIRDTDSISVVLSTSATKMHAFPVNSTDYVGLCCKSCGGDLF